MASNFKQRVHGPVVWTIATPLNLDETLTKYGMRDRAHLIFVRGVNNLNTVFLEGHLDAGPTPDAGKWVILQAVTDDPNTILDYLQDFSKVVPPRLRLRLVTNPGMDPVTVEVDIISKHVPETHRRA